MLSKPSTLVPAWECSGEGGSDFEATEGGWNVLLVMLVCRRVTNESPDGVDSCVGDK